MRDSITNNKTGLILFLYFQRPRNITYNVQLDIIGYVDARSRSGGNERETFMTPKYLIRYMHIGNTPFHARYF